MWLGFLDRIVDADSESQAFLRVFRYALTCATIEHAMFFLHGVGKNRLKLDPDPGLDASI
jgi:hypothetical protein